MTDEEKGGLHRDNPPLDPDAGDQGLGTETGAEGGPGDPAQDVTRLAPERRGEVRYPDKEEFSEERPTTAPVEGAVEEDPDTATDAAKGAEGD